MTTSIKNIAGPECTTHDYIWQPCSQTCGPGLRTGTKMPSAECDGNHHSTFPCNEGPCPGTYL